MGKYNDAMCDYLSRPDIFADYWNGVLFHGEQVLCKEELESQDGTYYITDRDEKTEKRSRDVVKRAANGEVYIILGIENQNDISYLMPLRRMEYDLLEYKRQADEIIRGNREADRCRKEAGLPSLWKNSGEYLSGYRKEDKLLPIVTITFYHGMKTYDGCQDLHEMIKWDQRSEAYREMVPNYPLYLVTVDELEEECFKTGLRELIGVMKRRGDHQALREYCEERKESFRKIDDDTIHTMGIMINYKELKQYRYQEGGVDMCKALEDIRQEGRQEGIAKTIFEMCQEFGLLLTDAIERVMYKCDMTREEAEAVAREYWK